MCWERNVRVIRGTRCWEDLDHFMHEWFQRHVTSRTPPDAELIPASAGSYLRWILQEPRRAVTTLLNLSFQHCLSSAFSPAPPHHKNIYIYGPPLPEKASIQDCSSHRSSWGIKEPSSPEAGKKNLNIKIIPEICVVFSTVYRVPLHLLFLPATFG